MVETLATYLQNMEVRRSVILEWAPQYFIKLENQLIYTLAGESEDGVEADHHRWPHQAGPRDQEGHPGEGGSA